MTEIKSLGREAFPFIADVSNAKEVDKMVKASASELGPLDTMIANAGIAQVKPLLELTEEDLKRMFEVNVYGVFNCYSSAARQMIQQGNGGKILGAARYVCRLPSIGELGRRYGFQAYLMDRFPNSDTYQYCGFQTISTSESLFWYVIDIIMSLNINMTGALASKWAVRGLTQAFAMEMATHGITVNAYAPGIGN